MTNNNNIVEEVQGAEATEGKLNMMIPTELVNKLELLFADEKIDFNKVLFTVYWINKGKWNGLKNRNESYQEVSSRYGNWISLVGKKGTDFLKKLVDGGIIKKVSGYVTAKHYTRYTLVNPFKYKGGDATGDNWMLYTLYPEDGAFVNKYLNDKHTVRILNKVKKEVKQPEVNEVVVDIATGEVMNVAEELNIIKMTLNEIVNNYNNLTNEVEKLKAENAELKAELDKKINKKVDVLSTLKSEMKQYTFTSINNEEPAPEVEIKEEVDYDNTPFFIDEQDDDVFGFVFPNQPTIVEAESNSNPIAVDELTKFIENKLKSSRVQPIYWNNAIKYIKENKEASSAIELGNLISISTGSSQVIINKVKQYWN